MKNIEVLPYDPNWPKQYESEAQKIKKALADDFVEIYHIGSTAVPGLAAKPKIDIIAEVENLNFDHKNLLNLNYEYRGGFNLPLRKSFTYRSVNLSVNLHVFEQNDPEIELNLLFRNYLRKNEAEKNLYAKLKYALIEDEASHTKNSSMYRGYTLGKQELIQNILEKSGFNRLRFVICTHYTEWDAAKKYRNKYFVSPNNIEDSYTWTFDHEDHKHFILYKGIEIIGYAHIQLCPKSRAAVRFIIIDGAKRRQGNGRQFMQLIEKWLKLQGYNSIHTKSSDEALKFYEQIGYVCIPFNDPDGYKYRDDDIAIAKVLKQI